MPPSRGELSSQISIAGSEGEALAAEPSAKAKGKQRAIDQDAVVAVGDVGAVSSSSRAATSTATTAEASSTSSWIPAKSWVHFVAGGYA